MDMSVVGLCPLLAKKQRKVRRLQCPTGSLTQGLMKLARESGFCCAGRKTAEVKTTTGKGMPLTPRQPIWLESLTCGVCLKRFDVGRLPVSLCCGHSVCMLCLTKLNSHAATAASHSEAAESQQLVVCPLDQSRQRLRIADMPVNIFILNLLQVDWSQSDYVLSCLATSRKFLESTLGASVGQEFDQVVENLHQFSKLLLHSQGLNKALQRKLLALVQCQIAAEEGRTKALRAARSLSERVVIELILQHQNQQQLTSHLWSAVRGRGCQFLGPAMQEEVLKLVLLALENGAALSRKVLVMFIVQKLKPQYQQASKTSVGHVVQLLYRASCFKVSKRDSDSSLMELKEEFCNYDALRREHDAQVIQIAQEAGLRIAPEQWSALLYGDQLHKSAMQSIIDKLQTTQFFAQSVQELMIAVQRSGDPYQLSRLRDPLDQLAHLSVDLSSNDSADLPTMSLLATTSSNALLVVSAYLEFINSGFARRIRGSPQHSLQPPNHTFPSAPSPSPSPYMFAGNERTIALIDNRNYPPAQLFPRNDNNLSVMDLNQVMFAPAALSRREGSATVVLNLSSNNPTSPNIFRPVSRQYSEPVRSQTSQPFEPQQRQQHERRRLQEDFYSAQVANSRCWDNEADGVKRISPGSWNDLSHLNDRSSRLVEGPAGLHRISSLSDDLHFLQIRKPEASSPAHYISTNYLDPLMPSHSNAFAQSANGSGFFDRNYLAQAASRSWSLKSSRNTSPQ